MKFKWIFLGALVFLGALNADARKTNKPDKTKKPAAESTTAAKSKKRSKTTTQKQDAGALEGVFPKDGSMRHGNAVKKMSSAEYIEHLKAMDAGILQLSPEEREAYLKSMSPGSPVPYHPAIWPDKKEYDKLIKASHDVWLSPIAPVTVGLQDLGEGMWRLNSAVTMGNSTKPMPFSSLSYDAKRNVWISGKNELTAQDFYSAENFFGELRGTEWSFKQQDDQTDSEEYIRIASSTDGKHTYLVYSKKVCDAKTGAIRMLGSVTLQFKNEDAPESN